MLSKDNLEKATHQPISLSVQNIIASISSMSSIISWKIYFYKNHDQNS